MTWDAHAPVCVVYGLASSADGKIRYVGQTIRKLSQRHNNHIWDSRLQPNCHRNKWINSVIRRGYEVLIFPIETNAVWGETEIRLIAWYRANGARLVNGTDGGDGTVGHKMPQDVIERQRKWKTGRKLNLTPEQKTERVAAMAEGRKKNAKAISAKISKRRTGCKLSPESIVKRTATRRARNNYIWTEAQKRRHSGRIKETWEKRRGIHGLER